MEYNTMKPIENCYQTRLINSSKSTEIRQTLTWLDLVIQEVESFKADDWLPLCNDIDEGEIYRDWFLWLDAEGTGEWEAYDPLTNQVLICNNMVKLQEAIDEVEDSRNSHPESCDRVVG